MNNYGHTSFLILLFLIFPVWAIAQEGHQKSFTVVIDPGHGGKDPGAVSNRIREKDIVLGIDLKLGEYLQNNLTGINVIYTRKTDIFVPLHRRAEIANKNKADLFISLHANSFRKSSITGTETFVLGLHRSEENLEVAKKENAVILLEDDYSNRYEGFDPTLSESYIMFEMVQNDYLNQSIAFAADIQNQFRTRAGRKDRSVKQAGFLVLRKTSMPSVLVEAGFLSNPSEANYMASERGQAILASAIFRAVREYKNRIENKSDYKLTTSENNIEKPAKPPIVEKPEMTDTKGIYFSIQLIASSAKLSLTSENFSGLSPVYRQKSGSLFKYFYGRAHSYEKINTLKEKAGKKFPDAFIVAFENEKPISVKRALKKIKP